MFLRNTAPVDFTDNEALCTQLRSIKLIVHPLGGEGGRRRMLYLEGVGRRLGGLRENEEKGCDGDYIHTYM